MDDETTTITISKKNWKKLTILKLDSDDDKIDDVICMLLKNGSNN